MIRNFKDIEKVSDLIRTNTTNFMHYFKHLVSLFEGEIDDAAYTRFNEIFAIARSIIPDTELINHIGPYFLSFKKAILNSDDEYMLNFDYETLIVEDCAPNTADLIRSMTINIKRTYLKNNEKLNSEIKDTIKSIVKAADRHKKLTGMIN